MIESAPLPSEPDLNPVLLALRQGDATEAARALAALDRQPAPETLVRLADRRMRRRRWAEAGWLLAQVAPRPAPVEMKRRLCANLACLRVHRPGLYDRLMAQPTDPSWTLGVSASGMSTVVCRRNGKAIALSPGNDPVAGARAALEAAAPVLRQGTALALCGVGDGYALDRLARDRTPLPLGQAQPIFVLEPSASALLQALMLHDYCGPAGPIEQARFFWFVGPAWAEELESAAVADPYLGCPATSLPLGIDGKAMHERLLETILAVSRETEALAERLAAHYTASSPRAELFGPAPSRTPRVLLVTTRFSTVLQHSTRDSADAFARLGWATHVVIEPTPAHRLYRPTLRRAVESFKPDLVFQIDHLRGEYPGIYPPALPFATWVQDHMTELKTPGAAASVSASDFVLTDAGAVYAATFGYPRRQLIALTKLTRPPMESAPAESGAGPSEPAAAPATCGAAPADDLVFVSNASHLPAALLRDRVESHAGPEAERTLLALAGARLIERYAGGSCAATWFELLSLVRAESTGAGLELSPDQIESIAGWLFHPLNDALYRQQALSWAARSASRLGLRLGLYGQGWERHPELREFARGPIAYGPDLESLTRRSPINLQIVPYNCMHQRLLDGLIAGGFYLVRDHPGDRAPAALLDFLHACTGPSAVDLASARALAGADRRPALDRLASACMTAIATSDRDDPVELVRDWESAQLLAAGARPLPRLDEIAFNDEASLFARLERFAPRPDDRAAIARAQRQAVLDRFTYDAGLKRVIDRMHVLLAENESPIAAGRAA